MSREDVIRQIVERDIQKQGLSEEVIRLESPQLYQDACEFYGTWDTALQYSGIRERRAKTGRSVPVVRSGAYMIGEDVSKEGVIRTIQKLCRGGYGLSAKGNRRRDRRLYHAALKYFGTWQQAIVAAGINPRRIHARQGEVKNRSELIAELRQRQQSGESLSLGEVFLDNRTLAMGVRSTFGSWKRGLLAAGLIDLTQLGNPLPHDRQQVLDAIRLRREDGQSLNQRMVEKEQRNLVYSAKLYFSSWRDAVEASMKNTPDEPPAQ